MVSDPTKKSALPGIPLKIVGIGASAGGLEAFTELVRRLPQSAPVAYVLVQHLDPTHRSLLSELLGRSATLPVTEIAPNTRVEANQIYVIPPNCDLRIEQGVLKLTQRDKSGGGPARSIDHFLKSLAADAGPNAIGVILSGAGSDGAEGLKAIKEAGGHTFAQDESSSKYDSMPRSAVATGCVDFVLPPDKIASEIARVVATPANTRRRAAANARNRRGRVSRKPVLAPGNSTPPAAAWPKGPDDADLRRIFLLLRTHTGIDFGLYRINTIRRRLTRRLALAKLKKLDAYYRLLREDREELEALHQDLLINVTSFFRNPGVFETLKKRIFPRLVKNLLAGDTLRFWIAGSSTGQEAYSYAIAFNEFIERQPKKVQLQIFATDVNASVLEVARIGRYAKTQLTGLSAARRDKFFTADHDCLRVNKSLRDQVIFAQQNLLTDPPFTRVDLISCRNMLIYIEPALQQKILPTFHYALKPGGVLVLGASESIGSFTGLFSTTEKLQKIYAKKAPVALHRSERPPIPPTIRPLVLPPARREPEVPPPALDAYREADRLMIARYAPPSVLVNDEGHILQFRGKLQPFLELPTGKATLSVVKLARGTLSLGLQRALKRARTERRAVRERSAGGEGSRQPVEITVIPFRRPDSPCYLVVFERVAPPAAPAGRSRGAGRPGRAEALRLAGMKRELGETRETLESLREQHETVVEELQASNEEVQSSNEELQSLNEELETSNEELESANEELTTLNEELATRNTELRESEQRLREQAQLVELAPLLARSPKDRIIFWNRGAERLYGFTRDEALGQTSHLLLRALYPEPLEKLQTHLERHGRWEGEVVHRRKDGTELVVASQWVIHTDENNRLRAVLEVNTDITARKRAEQSLRATQEFNQRILQSSPDCILVLDLAGRILLANEAASRAAESGAFPSSAGQHWTALWAAEARASAETAYRAALGGDTGRFQAQGAASQEDARWWDVVLRPIHDVTGHPERLLAICRDVTDRRQAELNALAESRLAALRADVALEITRGGDLPPILHQLAQSMVHHLDAVYARVWLVDDSPKLLRLHANAGPLAHLNQQTVVTIGEGRLGAIAASRRPFITHEVATDPELGDPEWARREGVVSFAGFPLVFESRLLGVLAVLSRRKIEGSPLRELSLTAEGVALLIQRKQADDERANLLEQALVARNAALEASRTKDEFLATLSHELRTPLNPVLLLASDHADNPELPPEVRATFETIRNNISLEAKLIDDLLDLTRIAHGKITLDLKPVDVNPLLAEAARAISSSAQPTVPRFALQLADSLPLVAGDAVRLQQVFWNLFTNALKFTPHGGTITIRTLVRDAHVVIEVSDTGIGMRESDLERIFVPFLQLERRRGGLGLGLAISRQLLELHQGRIRAVSGGPGKGSTFIIELPALPPGPGSGAGQPVRAAAAAAPTAARSERLRLLLVEDHTSTRTTLRTLLARRNFEVVTADSIAQARERVKQARFDILVSDLGLPDGHGHDLLREFRAHHPALVGLALSGYGSHEDRARSQAAGYASHLTKPVRIDELNQALEQMLAVNDSRQAGVS